jgi:hypothetical protein
VIDWESDLGDTIEGEFGVPVTLITPDGETVTKTVDGRPLLGKVRWSQPEVNPETGVAVAVDNPVVTLRRSSLSRVPATGENWFVIIPNGPRPDAVPAQFVLDDSYAVEGGRTLGKVRLPLVAAKQKGDVQCSPPSP